jgi:hypothetical protein
VRLLRILCYVGEEGSSRKGLTVLDKAMSDGQWAVGVGNGNGNDDAASSMDEQEPESCGARSRPLFTLPRSYELKATSASIRKTSGSHAKSGDLAPPPLAD